MLQIDSKSKKLSSKKRKLFFITHKRKNQTETNVNISINTSKLSLSEKTENINDSKNNTNLEEMNEREKNLFSLREISGLVKNFIMEKKNSTYKQVTEYVIRYLYPKKTDILIQKNIKRRVYDALNIMCAIGFIKKNNQQITLTNNSIFSQNINLDENSSQCNTSDKELEEKSQELKNLQKILIKKYLYIKFVEKINLIHELQPEKTDEVQIKLPFEFLKSSHVKYLNNKDSNGCVLISDEELPHFNEYDIVRYFIGPDIMKKINNSDNIFNNNSNNGVSSNKSTNEESFIDINSKISISNDEYNEDEIFNYLKNLELFKDELAGFDSVEEGEIYNLYDFNISKENNKEVEDIVKFKIDSNNSVIKSIGEE